MASTFTEVLGQSGLWGELGKLPRELGSKLKDVGQDFGSGWRDVMGEDGFMRNWWSGDMGGGTHSNVNLRNFAKFVGGQELGSGIDDYTGGNWGGSAVKGLQALFGGMGKGRQGTNNAGTPNDNGSDGGIMQQQPFGSSGGAMNGVRGDMGTSIWSKINIPQQKNQLSIDTISRQTPPTALQAADRLASQGRYGDTNLLHVSDDELNQLGATGKLTQNPSTGLPEAFGFSDLSGMMPGAGQVFGGLLGGGMGNQSAGQIQRAGDRGVSIGAPLENTQRQPYQQQLSGLMNDPSSFLSNDPYIQASKKAIGDQYQANFAKSGNLPFSSIQGSAAMQQMMSQAYNDRIRQLTTLGGFDQGPGYGGNIAYQSGLDAATGRNNARTGGINQIFGGLGGMMGGSGGSGIGGLFSGFGNLFGGGGSSGGGGGGDPELMGQTFPTDEFDF